jgi:VWFA-related protein
MSIGARLASFLLASLTCIATASAHQASPETQATKGKMYLDVVVAPKSGPPVADLQQQDFTLLDNKAPQTTTSFEAVTGREASVEAIVVIDAVNAAVRTVNYERIQIDKLLRADEGRLTHPIALAVFTDKGIQLVGNFSNDGNALSAALDREDVGLRIIGRSEGLYGAAERLELSLQALRQLLAAEAPRQGRKVILWVSPGWPLLSGPRIELDSKQQKQIFADVVSLSTQLRQARVTLYSIDPLGASESLSRASYYKDFLKGISKPSQVQLGNLGLPVLAIQSGGLALNFSNDIASLLQECLSDTTPYYRISFDPPQAQQRDEYHHLEIQLAKPGLTARTRQGYYAQPISPD